MVGESFNFLSILPSFLNCMLFFIFIDKKLTKQNDKRGMTVSSGSVIIKKDQSNLIGISIGGGAPYCPCLYIVQVLQLRNFINFGSHNINKNCYSIW